MSPLIFLHFLTILTCCLAGSIKLSNNENGPSYRNQKRQRSLYGGPSFGSSYGYTSIGSRTLQLSCVPDQMSIGFYLCQAINPTAAQLYSYPTYGYTQNIYGQSLGNYGTIPQQLNYQPRYPNPYGMSSNYIQSEILPPGGSNPITINCNSPTGGAGNQPGVANNPTGGANNQQSCNCSQTPGMNSPQQPTGGSSGGANGGNQIVKTQAEITDGVEDEAESIIEDEGGSILEDEEELTDKVENKETRITSGGKNSGGIQRRKTKTRGKSNN